MIGRSSSSKKQVVWDEDNLQQNEEIQKQYSAVCIAEPKTPYRPPLPADSLEDEMRPLQLDEVADALHNNPGERMTAFEYVMSNGGSSYDGDASSSQQQQQQTTQQEPPEQQQEPPQEPDQQQQQQPSQQQQQQPLAGATSNASAEADGDDEEMYDTVGDKRSEPCTSFTSSGSEGSADKRRRFELMRRQHYNMKDALLKARQLLASEDEDGDGQQQQCEEDEEEEEDDTAGCQRMGNGAARAAAGTSRQQQQPQSQADGSQEQQQQPSSRAS